MTTPASTRQEVTQLLGDWSGGDEGALEKLFPLVQPELHRLAHHYMSRERAGHTLQTTAILNEAYLRLVDNTKPVWQGRSHFIAAAAQLMRRIMVDHARERHSLKRGGGALKVTLDEAALVTETRSEQLLALDEALESLAAQDPRKSQIVELPGFEVAAELLTNERANALVGKLIGHYRIESLIGVGGMGEVYLARDERLGRKAALKLLPDSLTTDETQLSRFKNEARTASALNHPNILTVYEIGAEGNRQFIATEFIEGITLRVSIGRGRINPHTALEIAVQVASALAAEHEAGVVKRDIKTENIMLRPADNVKWFYFEIAKLNEQRLASHDHTVETTAPLQTRPGLVLGTARYMSPEQARGRKVDVRTDIWSLGG